MKRPVKNVQLRLDQTTFESLKEYKDAHGLANLSETIEKLVLWHMPSIEHGKPEALLEITPAPEAPSEPESFDIETSIPIPASYTSVHMPNNFSEKVTNTLKKMNVGDSIVVSGKGQRATTFNMAKRLNMSIKTLSISGKGKDAKIRIWRSA